MIKMKIMFLILLLVFIFGFYYSTPKEAPENPKEAPEKHQGSWDVLTEDKTLHTVGFSRIFFFDKDNGIAQTVFEIKKTADSGKRWTSVKDFDGKAFFSLLFTDNQTGWTVGTSKRDKPFILKSKDKGSNWEEIIFDNETKQQIEKNFTLFYDICFNSADKSWIVGDGGIIEVITNRLDWKMNKLFSTDETLYSIGCNDLLGVWAVGNNGTVLHYTNEWNKQKLGNNITFLKVKVMKNSVWLLGNAKKITQPNEETPIEGVLLRTIDNGKTWEDKTPASAEGLRDIYFNGDSGWLVGKKGSIYSTRDGGNSWTKSKSPTNVDLLNIVFLDSNDGWISGDRATILKYQN